MLLAFDQVTDLGAVGNKAQSLILMRREGLPVPDGFVLDRDCYRAVIEENGIAGQIDEYLRRTTKENVGEMSEKIRALFDRATLNDALKTALREQLKRDRLYAVRSSGTKEDLDAFSFAGQYESFLNVAPADVEQHIFRCYQSMFSLTVLGYLLNNGISLTDVGMTVIVQEMVPSERSGICFTLDPIIGNDKEMVIEVGEGLGENIVSGKVAPEQYYYNWYNETFRADESNRLLDEAMLKKAVAVFDRILQFYGYPCDIEFGIAGGEVYILQARKITKINYEGIRELWTTADFKDGGVSASVCLPYMWSLYEYIWEYTLKKFILDSKILKEKDISKKLGEMFYGRPYWNLSVVKKAMSQVVGYKEREFDSEYGIKIHYEGDGETTKVSLKSLTAILRMAIAQKKILKTRNQNAQRYKDELLEKYYAHKTAHDSDSIADIKATWYRVTHDDYLFSESTYFWQIFINTIHQSLYKDGLLKYVSESEYLTLLGSINDISHMLPFYAMWDISRAIRADKALLREWQETDAEQLAAFVSAGRAGKVWDDVRKLIADYGYHSEKELDVAYPCYYEDFVPMIVSIKDMTALEDSFSPLEDQKKGKAAHDRILSDVRKKVSPGKYRKIETKVENMRKMLWWREEFRDLSTRFYYIIRIYTIRLAAQLVRDGVLATEDDVWFLKVGQLWDFLDGKTNAAALREIVRKNRRYYNAYRNYMSENEIGRALSGDGEESAKPADGLQGLGANGGTVTGTARVIRSFEEIDRLQKNDILVTKFTDTGWTPKFAILSGIVTEYGGILCHAAIVSREYGIPAIVSCHNVMETIRDGQTVTIDGATGKITVDLSATNPRS